MLSTLLRSFIAVEIPPEIQQAIAQSTAGLQKSLPKPLIRWVPPENIHLTLQFLGEVSQTDLERLATALKVESAAHAPIEITVSKIGAFPNPRRARVIWVGLDTPASLPALQKRVASVTAQAGISSKERDFSPHLTIGRVSQNAGSVDLLRINACLQQTSVDVLGDFQAKAIHIYKSDLSRSGPTYTRLFTMLLTGEQQNQTKTAEKPLQPR